MKPLLTLLSLSSVALAAEPPAGYRALFDLPYANTTHERQRLDLYVPKDRPAKALPLIVFIHGGGWEAGSKNDGGALFPLLAGGDYVGASVGYRLTNDGPHPMQIHDCKAALRWLRAHAADYQFDPEKIGVYGISAGGHLVSLLGTSSDVAALNGTVGEHDELSTKVTCVANFCGPANFLTFGAGAIDPNKPNSALGKLFGGAMKDRESIAKAASPVTYITADDAPFLHIHGTKDNLVPYAQATEFDAKLRSKGVPSALITGQGAPHVFFNADLIAKLKAFFAKHLRGKGAGVQSGEIQMK
jgi:acetyl esterase/lipase